ncbi:MAG: hypothetical protein J6D01_00010 [Muribaculaceae bacterium]|nr:hypothetical protein [Muribaculaceae bacterium]
MRLDWLRRLFPILFVLISVAVVGGFLYYSGTLVDELAAQERARMQIWANATRQIINGDDDSGASPGNLEFLLSIIEDNRSIPLLLTDDEGEIIMQRNFTLPSLSTAWRNGNCRTSTNATWRLSSTICVSHPM